MKIDWYCLCYNEEFIIPWIVQYWEKIRKDGIDLHVYVWDNYSTDKSVEILSKYDWITVNYFKTEGQDDIRQAMIKNTVWKNSKGKADFVCVTDFDEIIWSNDLKSELQKMKDGGYNVLGTQWFAFCGDEIPVYTEDKYLHQLVGKGYKQYINHMPQYKDLGKFMIIDPNLIETMNWSVGNHICNPKPQMKLYISDKIVAFHVNKGLSEDYFVNKRKIMGKNLSENNRKCNMCYEYNFPEEKSRKEYREYQKNSFDINLIYDDRHYNN